MDRRLISRGYKFRGLSTEHSLLFHCSWDPIQVEDHLQNSMGLLPENLWTLVQFRLLVLRLVSRQPALFIPPAFRLFNICAPLHRKGLYLNKVCVQNGFTLQVHGSLAEKDKVFKFNYLTYDVSIAARIFQSHRDWAIDWNMAIAGSSPATAGGFWLGRSIKNPYGAAHWPIH